MRTGLIVGLGVTAAVFLGIGWVVGTSNGFVTLDENVKQTYAQTQNVMQRQADLIPNLLETVKGAASFESTTLTKVIEARNWATRPIVLLNGQQCEPVSSGTDSKVPKCDAAALSRDPNAQRALAEAQQAMMSINVNALREQYPTLKSTELFVSLTSQLEGSINRVTVERRRNQLAVEEYNRSVRSIPAKYVAGFQGFTPMPYFAATNEAQSTPKVKF